MLCKQLRIIVARAWGLMQKLKVLLSNLSLPVELVASGNVLYKSVQNAHQNGQLSCAASTSHRRRNSDMWLAWGPSGCTGLGLALGYGHAPWLCKPAPNSNHHHFVEGSTQGRDILPAWLIQHILSSCGTIEQGWPAMP